MRVTTMTISFVGTTFGVYRFSLSEQLAAILAGERRSSSCRAAPSQNAASGRVLEYLRSEHVFRRQCEIRAALNMGHPSVAWALLCLRRMNLVDVVPDVSRNPRYMRYRAKHL